MRIAIHSDLHLERYALDVEFLSDSEFDVLVLAGDIVSARTISRLDEIRSKVDYSKTVIFVPGNHEYYGGDAMLTPRLLQEYCESIDFIYADRNTIKVGDVTFICTTAWSTLESYPQYTMYAKRYAVRQCINDVRVVNQFTIDLMVERGIADREYIERELKRHSRGKCVVINHIAPLPAFNHRGFDVSELSAYFANDYRDIIEQYNPAMWIYGHTHDNVIGMHCNTRIVSNQRGYGRECYGSYNPNYVTEV